MNRPIRILYVNGGQLDYGGISTVMLAYASHFDRSRVAVDFLVHGFEKGPRESEARALGANVIHVPLKGRDFSGNRRALLGAFRRGGYDAVHAHMDGMNGYVLALAKKAGVKERISHCHNTQFLTTNPLRVQLHRLTADRIPRVATRLMACSEKAARFLYGDARVDDGAVTIVKNAIALGRFRFEPAARAQMRRALAVEDRFVIGCVGRLDYQKNQAFLLPVLTEVRKARPDAVLLLAGDGADRAALTREIEARDLGDAVRLLGYCDDIPALMCAFDLFVLPSRFEGLGIVLIEAQRNGLPCIASAEVPTDTRVTDCRYLPCTDPSAWARAILETPAADDAARAAVSDAPFSAAGYDIHTEAERLMRIYEDMLP